MYKYFFLFVIVLNLYAVENQELLKPKGILELKNAQTVLGVGGRIQLDATYGDGSVFAGKIPMSTAGEDGYLTTSARNSRFWIKTRTPSEYGPIRTIIEVDFYGVSGTETNTNSHGLRLRHAYVVIDGFTFGQTNSAFNSLVTLDTINYVINDTFVRQPVIRYALNARDIVYDISLEQPETTLLDSQAEIITPKDDVVPDVVLRSRIYESWGEASFALLARYINQDSVLEDSNTSDNALGFGVNISAKLRLYDLDDIRFDFQYGDGLGRYIAYDAYAVGSIDDNGKIALQTTSGTHLGYRHWWSHTLRSTIAVSYVATKNNLEHIAIADRINVNKSASSYQVNLLWIPVKNALFGVEYSQAIREVESGDEGKINLLTFLYRYNF